MLAPAWDFAQPDLDDRFSVSLGAFITTRDTDTRLDSNTLGKGTTINLEEDLGLDTSDSVFRLDSHYRCSPPGSISVSATLTSSA